MKQVMNKFGGQIINRDNAGKITVAFALTGATILLTSSSPFLFGSLVADEGLNFMGIQFTVSQVLKLYGTSMALSKVMPFLRRMLLNPIISKITFDTAYQFDDQMMKQPHSYHIATPSGVKQEMLVVARTSTTEFLTLLLHNIFPSFFEMGTAIGILSKCYGWSVGPWIFALAGFSTIYSVATSPLISGTQAKYLKDRMATTRNAVTLWSHFENVYYFNTVDHELYKLRMTIDQAQRSDLDNLQIPERIFFAHSLVTQSLLFGLIVFVGEKLLSGEYSRRDLSIIVYFLIQITLPLNNLAESVNKIRAISHDLAPIFLFMDKKIKGIDKRPSLQVNANVVELKFNNVKFAYKEGSSPVLNGVSFDAKSGQTVAIVGYSGGGKTTIARLLYRFYDPQEGEITLNGQNISHVDLSSLLNILSIVPQNPTLFNNTLRYNIAYGLFSTQGEKIPDSLIWEAIRKVGLLEFAQREGLDKKVGEGGMSLSGGQLLRVAIARAIIRNAPIIFLDEYTASLDAQTEAFIQNELKEILKNKLKIVVTHRLSTIQDADTIMVMDQGRISEQGTFQELLSKDGLFKRFWSKQQRGVQIDDKEGDEKDKKKDDKESEVAKVEVMVDAKLAEAGQDQSSTMRGRGSMFFSDASKPLLESAAAYSDSLNSDENIGKGRGNKTSICPSFCTIL